MYNDKIGNAGSKEVMNFANSWTIIIDIEKEKKSGFKCCMISSRSCNEVCV